MSDKKFGKHVFFHTIRARLLLVMIGLIIGIFLFLFLSFQFLLKDFYRTDKIRTLHSIYERLNTLSDNDEDFTNEILSMTEESNVQILVTDSDFTEINATTKEPEDLARRLFGYYTGFFNDDIEELETGDGYILQISEDTTLSLQYLEMWGQLSNYNWFLIRTPMEGMEEAVHIAMSFLWIVAAIALAVGMIVVFATSTRITKPITRLTLLSKRMAAQDFSAHYEGHDNSEIGELGTHFNVMSAKLEHTISQLKNANNELQKDVEKKTEIDNLRKEFINNVSHELKTPIALIQGYAEGLKDNIAEDPESMEFYCDVIIDEANKMNKMVRSLLTLNQLEFGQDTVQLERIDLTALIKGVIGKMGIMIEQKEAQVVFDASRTVMAWGDEFKIEEVVTNFMSNALNHLDYEKRIEVKVEEKDGLVTTTVFNTGDPIPEADLERVWEKFYKVDKARTREYGGSGIGLSIVKAIMEAHHQTCGVRNFDNGVAFFFTLEIA